MAAKVTIDVLLDLAASLYSENGENPEYDRALVNLISDILGLSSDDHDVVRQLLIRRAERLRA